MRYPLKKIAVGVASILLLGTCMAFAETELVLEPDAELSDPGPNVDSEAGYVTSGDGFAEPRHTTYNFSIGPGGSYHNYGGLEGTYPGCKDTYNMTITATTKVTIEVADCCVMGDTICFGTSPAKKVCATSPSNPTAQTTNLRPGRYTFYVTYSDKPGGGVGGYDIYVTGM